MEGEEGVGIRGYVSIEGCSIIPNFRHSVYLYFPRSLFRNQKPRYKPTIVLLSFTLGALLEEFHYSRSFVIHATPIIHNFTWAVLDTNRENIAHIDINYF